MTFAHISRIFHPLLLCPLCFALDPLPAALLVTERTTWPPHGSGQSLHRYVTPLLGAPILFLMFFATLVDGPYPHGASSSFNHRENLDQPGDLLLRVGHWVLKWGSHAHIQLVRGTKDGAAVACHVWLLPVPTHQTCSAQHKAQQLPWHTTAANLLFQPFYDVFGNRGHCGRFIVVELLLVGCMPS